VREAIAFAVHLEDADVMGQAIEERACETLRANHPVIPLISTG
jgi:hypothetical protein